MRKLLAAIYVGLVFTGFVGFIVYFIGIKLAILSFIIAALITSAIAFLVHAITVLYDEA